MPVRLLRRILSLLIVTAYVSATLLPVAPGFAADTQTHAAMASMTQDQDQPGDTMPCRGKTPGCVSDLGCLFLVSLPAPDLTLVTVTAWSSVSYDYAFQGLRGRTIKPALGPPIPLA